MLNVKDRKVLFVDRNQELIDILEANYEEGFMDVLGTDGDQTLNEALSIRPYDYEAEFHCGDFFDVPARTFVSPANSFGYMDGGIDLVYVQKFGWDLQRKTMKTIEDTTTFGELFVGEARKVPVQDADKHNDWTWMICAPTMRMPQPVPQIHAFLSARAATWCWLTELPYSPTLAMPGMGTATGKIPYPQAAYAMLTGVNAAFRKYFKEKT